MKVKVMQNDICNRPCAIPWQISLSKNKDITHFCAKFHSIFEILAFPMFDIENLGHDRAVEKMFATIPLNICKSPT